MIFQQWRDILAGSKTQTRRLVKPDDLYTLPVAMVLIGKNPGEVVTTAPTCVGGRLPYGHVYSVVRNKRVIYQRGKSYAIVPKRGQRAIWFRWLGELQTTYDDGCPASIRAASEYFLKHDGWEQARITLAEIRVEPLQNLSVDDAWAEGAPVNCTVPIQWYAELWNRINNRKGIRWEDNPNVWVLGWRHW